jgi:hypothetical protein
MKKTFLLLAFLHIVTSSFCTNNTITKTYDFGAVKSIDAGSIYNIEVTEGKQKGVTIVCDPSLQEHLDVKYFHGELILSMKPNTKIVNGNGEGVKVYLQMETIEELDLSGAAKLKVDGQFKNNEMDMELSGASAAKISNLSGNSISIECSGASKLDIADCNFSSVEIDASGASNLHITSCRNNNLEIEASGASKVKMHSVGRHTETSCSGASKIILTGDTDHFRSETTGASNLTAQDFYAKNGYAEVTGASNAKIRCSGDLKVMVSKIAKLTHYGNPNIINIDTESNIRKGDD